MLLFSPAQSFRHNVQRRTPPQEHELANCAHGMASLPWDSAGFVPRAEIECVAKEFRAGHHEWCRAREELAIVRREVIDSTQYYGEQEELILGALESLADSEFGSYTVAEGHAFYLHGSAAAVIDVHRRMLGIAGAVGAALDMCTPVNGALAALIFRHSIPASTGNSAAGMDSDRDSAGSESEQSDDAEESDEEDSDSE